MCVGMYTRMRMDTARIRRVFGGFCESYGCPGDIPPKKMGSGGGSRGGAEVVKFPLWGGVSPNIWGTLYQVWFPLHGLALGVFEPISEVVSRSNRFV